MDNIRTPYIRTPHIGTPSIKAQSVGASLVTGTSKDVIATPVITLTGNSVTITCDTTGATIYYTLDGSTPTSSSTQYSAAFTLDSSCTIKAIAIKGGKSSAVAEESYVKPVTYLTKWKIVGNSEVHGTEIWSCGEYSEVDGKYHILVQPLGGSIADIALDEPLRKVNDVADTIEFPVVLEAFCNTDGSQILTTLPDDTILHIKQFVKNGDFSDGSTDWTIVNSDNISCDFTQGKAIIQHKVQGRGYRYGIRQDIRSNIVIGNAYYWKYDAVPCKNIQLGADFSDRSTAIVSCIGNTNNIVSNIDVPESLNQFFFGYPKTEDYEVGNTTEVDNVVSFDLDVMFADCPSLKPITASDFEALFTNINYVAYSDTVIDVIVKDGKLYKYVETEGKASVTRNIAIAWWKNMGITYQSIYNEKVSDYERFFTTSLNGVIGNITGLNTSICLSANYEQHNTPVSLSYVKDRCMCVYNENVYIRDIDCHSKAEFEAKNANNYFFYVLATPTTELVNAPQIAEADSYTCEISQGAKTVSWSSFEIE